MNGINVVILSGGVGSRLWPLSRKSRPKQYLDIFDSRSLFGLTIERNRELASKFIVVGNGENHQLSRKELDDAGVDYQEIVEAIPRNTAGAIAFAAFVASEDEILLVVPSDHIIENQKAYEASVSRALELAQQGFLVTFGIKPTKPETGYGYIEADGENVKSFREKPNRDTAVSFMNSGRFLWNSGMFCFKAGVFLSELQKYEPEIFNTSKKAWEKAQNGHLSLEDMDKIPSKSIDYAVMEKSKLIKVVAADFGWSDLGSFESLYEYFSRNGNPPDADGNMSLGKEMPVYFLGLKNTVFVNTDDAVLILRKENAQDVKNIFEELDKQNSPLIK